MKIIALVLSVFVFAHPFAFAADDISRNGVTLVEEKARLEIVSEGFAPSTYGQFKSRLAEDARFSDGVRKDVSIIYNSDLAIWVEFSLVSNGEPNPDAMARLVKNQGFFNENVGAIRWVSTFAEAVFSMQASAPPALPF